MQRVYDFLKKAQVFYIATMDGDQPRVRPFGALHIHDGKLYTQTNRNKPVSKQLAINPKVEISAWAEGTWVRIACQLVEDPLDDVKESYLAANPAVQQMYKDGSEAVQMLRFDHATVTFSTFTTQPETYRF